VINLAVQIRTRRLHVLDNALDGFRDRQAKRSSSAAAGRPLVVGYMETNGRESTDGLHVDAGLARVEGFIL